ncbi:MAG: ABC transporter substrate-binding protein [Alphaproteobacteria bacterium]|nr:ABC transporter substrate-binding protein [Alphaproteobacteria bacterium]
MGFHEHNGAVKRILLAAAIAAGMSAGHSAQALEPLAMTYVPANAVYWDLDVAIERGFFRDEGFSPSIVSMQSSPGGIQEAVGHSVQLAGGSPEPSIEAYEHGATDIGFIGAPVRGVDWTLNVLPSIKSLADLKGKTIGVSAIKGGELALTRALLAKGGLKPGDYDVIQVGVSPLKLAAMKRGSIAAAALFQPSGLLARKIGFPVLIDFTTVPSYPYPTYTVGRSWAHAQNNGKRLARAIVRAQKWLADRHNRQDAIAVLGKYTKSTPDILNATYDMYFVKPKIMDGDGKLDLAGMRRLLAIIKAQGDLSGTPDPGTFVIPAADGGLYR